MNNKLERLQKVLAHAGIASRRASEQLIKDGRVTVNGKVVTQMGVKINLQRDKITVDGKLLDQAESMVYIMLNKPTDVLSTTHDDRKRITVLDLVTEVEERVYPVGRLDQHSEGLILLTNDGALAEKLTHPRYHLEKEYEVLLTGKPSLETIKKWRQGEVKIPGEPPLKPAWVQMLKGEHKATWYKVILTEGRKRQIRTVADILGHRVKRLERVRIGPLRLGKLKLGHWRYLTPREVNLLRQTVNKPPKKKFKGHDRR
ncbi:pseudouridine synthase [Anaerolineales bacterium HSG6]|nr:pseudouridine synthase [Anaerolineales bacterium HSG6]MDM8529598.1 pseudouridine synthase [Anaerolineales bacterium HSG25]